MWDDRYSEDGYAYGIEPNDFLKDSIKHIKPEGKVLCLGEGEGRNALFLKKNGFEVTAVDLSPVGRQKALKLFKDNGYGLDYKVENLVDFDFGKEKWDAVISIFCHLPERERSKFHEKIEDSLILGGVFISEGYSKAQIIKTSGGPREIEMLFSTEELNNSFSRLSVTLNHEVERELHEGQYHNGVSSVVQFVGKK